MKKEKVYQNKYVNELLQFDTKNNEFRKSGCEREYKVNDELYVFSSVPQQYDGKYTIDDFQFSCTTRRLLVYLIMKFTNLSEVERQQGEIEFTVKEFMELCNLKDRDNTKRMIEKDLFSLFCIRAEWNGCEIFIIEDFKSGRGKFTVILDPTFADNLMKFKGIVLLPISYFMIPINRTPESANWILFLIYLTYKNSKSTNKNRISVNSLLNRSSFMSIDEIRNTSNCSVKERVTFPLIRNLNSLSETFEFKYFSKTGRELTERQLQNLTYDELIKVIIHYEIK